MSDSQEATDFSQLPSTAQASFQPFKVHVPKQELEELQILLKHSRIGPETYENGLIDERFGITRDWLQDAVHTWKTSFDWRKHEQNINSFPAYTTNIKDAAGTRHTIHFVGLFSQRSDATALLLLHGWPGSFLEFLPILSLLRTRYTPATLPYHIIVPSLPGYGFSSRPPLNRDFRLEDVAYLFNALMTTSLGFPSYIVQGGDIGSKIARIIAATYPACHAIHLNFCIMTSFPNSEPPTEALDTTIPITPSEQQGILRTAEFIKFGSAYALLHATKPATLGLALSSSPIALLTWIAEKFLAWSDTPHLSIETILTSVSLYWFTNSFATSLYPYRQLFTPGVVGVHEDPEFHIPTEKPFGFSWFPKELAPVPRRWVETTAERVVFWREHEKGGHFAALERPEDLWEDVEEFVKIVLKD